MSSYNTIITNNGKALFANAATSAQKVNITHLAVGDGGGTAITPTQNQSKLVAERHRVAVISTQRHPTNANWIEVNAVIPSSSGGYTVREIGLYAGSTLVAIGSFPATYKPAQTEGGAREMSIRIIIAVENASVVTVTLDDSLVYSTRKWTQDNFVNHNEVIDNLASTETTKPLSAAQGKKLQDGKLGKTENAVSATKLATARTLAITGDGTGQASFDGSNNANIALTLTNSGVTAGSYNSVTVDAKGRVTAGLTQTHGLVTATTATGTANVATGNGNTFLNIVASGVGQTASVGSSTQITGTNGITVSSDTAGKLIVTRDSNSPTATKLATARTINGVAFDGTQNITITDNTKAPVTHRHNWSEIDGKPSTYPPATHSHAWGEITGKPSTFPPSAHRHNWNDIDGKPAVINNPTRISSGDLNDYKDAGFYLCESNVEARAIANTASNRAFALQVVQVAGVVQIFREHETAIVYMRAFYVYTGRWSAWKRLATTEDNAPTATKLATARTIAMTGDGSWNVNFDGSQNATGVMTLSNSGVTAGSYNSVTVDAKGRVTAGLTQTHGLVTATTATGTANTATTNSNTFLNIVASGVGTANSVGSSTQITGTNGIAVSSDTAGKLIITRDSNSPTATKLATARNIALTGAVTGSVAFDGSHNVSISTTLTKAVIRDHSRTINAPRIGYTTNTIDITGQTVVSPDGRITQYFHLKHFRDFWFDFEDAGVGVSGDRGVTIPLALWTAMPNKVLSVIATPMRSANATLSTTYFNEASELIAAWAYRKQGSDKSNVWVDLARHSGSNSEQIDLLVIVEGY